MLTAQETSKQTFERSLRGYDVDEVDDFLGRIIEALAAWEGGHAGALTTQDVRKVTFGTALRGYDLDEVDDFLDEVVATLEAHSRSAAEGRTPDHVVDRQSDPKPLNPWKGEDQTGAQIEHDLDDASMAARTAELFMSDEVTNAAQAIPEQKEMRPAPESEAPAAAPSPLVSSPPEQPPPSTTATPSATRLSVAHTDDSSRTLTVLLDDQPIGKLKPGQTETFDIPEGMHWVTVSTRKDNSNVQVIEPRQGDQIRLTCGQAVADELDDLGRRVEGISLQRVE